MLCHAILKWYCMMYHYEYFLIDDSTLIFNNAADEIATLKNAEPPKGVCLSVLEYHGLVTTFIVSLI